MEANPNTSSQQTPLRKTITQHQPATDGLLPNSGGGGGGGAGFGTPSAGNFAALTVAATGCGAAGIGVLAALTSSLSLLKEVAIVPTVARVAVRLAHNWSACAITAEKSTPDEPAVVGKGQSRDKCITDHISNKGFKSNDQQTLQRLGIQ